MPIAHLFTDKKGQLKSCTLWFLISFSSLTCLCAQTADDLITSLVFDQKVDAGFIATLGKAEQGDGAAQVDLGNMFSLALHGAPTNYAEAFRWYSMAAEQGNAAGQSLLAECLAEGKGAPVDVPKAVGWFRRSAEQGVTAAQISLARLYAEGRGTPKNVPEAYKWFSIAAAQGNSEASSNRVATAKLLTLDQILEAEHQVAMFRPKPENQSGVALFSDTAPAKNTGPFFFVSDDGYLIANLHVTKGAKRLLLKTAHGLTPVQLVRGSVSLDLAVFKAEGQFQGLPLASQAAPVPDRPLYTSSCSKISWNSIDPELIRLRPVSSAKFTDPNREFAVQYAAVRGLTGGCVLDESGNAIGLLPLEDSVAGAELLGGPAEKSAAALKGQTLLQFLKTIPELQTRLKKPLTGTRTPEELRRKLADSSGLLLGY
ncbi:MAG TPA: tetratricopeptide repeat-containing serine protease family protein [Verrucomicrobiae bacterium]